MPPPELARAIAGTLQRLGLLPPAPAGVPAFVPVGGGRDSEVWRVDLPSGAVVVKRALPPARSALDVHGPPDRQSWDDVIVRGRREATWLGLAGELVPGSAPRLLGFDGETGALAMAWLDTETHAVWERQLLRGEVDPCTAGLVGDRLGRLHDALRVAVAGAHTIADVQAFVSRRLDPYLNAAARARPDVAGRLHQVRRMVERTPPVVIHGDVEPGNVLAGPDGPVLLDADRAALGDPAFDLAFCLDRLLLKCVVMPVLAGGLLACVEALDDAYLSQVRWERAQDLDWRAAALVPALLLARTGTDPPTSSLDEAGRQLVQEFARRQLTGRPPSSIRELAGRWSSWLR